ncbi:MAG: MFS transporter [Candidatus Omnitrophota bacterium]|jgi:OPA family sugar phosphate sensor protein UhpC-like MFS transporter|nr:MAG: MFS transporter [Candidatus Omnitrophota bacterium]
MNVWKGIANFYRTGPDKPLRENENEIRKIYERKRREVFLAIVFGYSFYYVTRLSISVAKKPMIDSGVLDAAQLGKIGFAIWLSYAFGKLISGFIADHCNMRKFMTTGLLVSAVINILFGFSDVFLVFLVLWFLNGWFQSMGCAPSVVVMSQWFSNRERGTRYGLWSAAHSIGEGITFVLTAVVISYFGWRWGFWSAGGITIGVAILMAVFLADRPRTLGLPAIAEYKNDHSGEEQTESISIWQAQKEVLLNSAVWILGLSSACMYVARYGISSWGVMFLQEAKDYSIIAAGSLLGLAKIVETVGAVSSGFVSDFFFGSRRNVVALFYGLVEIVGLIILFTAPSTHLFNLDPAFATNINDGPASGEISQVFQEHGFVLPENAYITSESYKDFNGDQRNCWIIHCSDWAFGLMDYTIHETAGELHVGSHFNILHVLGASMFGFGLGGLLVFLGGLMAVDICSKRATGAAMGLVGVFSYLGAAVQEWVSGNLIEAGKTVVEGQSLHDFNSAILFWLGAAILAVLLSSTLWNVKAKK